MTLQHSHVLDLRLGERLSKTEGTQVLYYLRSKVGNADRATFSRDELREPSQVFVAAVDRGLPIYLVADAIDLAAQKKTIADELRARIPALDMTAYAADYFDNNNQAKQMVIDDMFNRAGRQDSGWVIGMGMSVSEFDKTRGFFEEGWRRAFDRWLEAGHTLGELTEILNKMGARILASDLGLIDLRGRPASVTLTRSAPKVCEELVMMSGFISSNPQSAPACAFAPIDEDASPEEPTLGQLVQNTHRARSFKKLLITMSESDLWHAWLVSEGLARGVAAERFVARIRSELESDPDFDAMDEVLRELVKLAKYRYMTRSEFIESLKSTKNPAIVSAALNWSAALARTISDCLEPIDFAKEEHDGRADLRAFFKNNNVFRGKSAASRLETALNRLATDDIGIYEPHDLKCLAFADLKSLNVFNVNEARKVETAAAALK